jgi:hypothetical protein
VSLTSGKARQSYVGGFDSVEEVNYGRYYAYKLISGGASHLKVEPNGISEFQKETVRATVEAGLRTVRGR